MTKLSSQERRIVLGACIAIVMLACLPLFDEGYWLSLGVSIVMYAALCTAWTLFSGPTHYISLATAAFFGIGTYTVGVGIELLPFPLLIIIAALLGAVLASLVGITTLRLSGVYFVIFTLGLAELIRQVVTWVQTNFTSSTGLYVLTDIGEKHVYWMLLVLTGVIFLTGWLINRSRLGFAMRIIGNDEIVSRHVGIDTARAKVVLFSISGSFIAVIGAILSPRFAYIEPPSAFNPMISFMVVIMALMGGANRLWGPLLGVIPLTLLFDSISARFPNHSNILLGVSFLVIVYFIPHGVIGLLQRFGNGRQNRNSNHRGATGKSGQLAKS